MRVKATDADAWDYRTVLDGVELQHCVEADDAEGWADVIVRDANGALKANFAGTGPKLSRLTGKVELSRFRVSPPGPPL